MIELRSISKTYARPTGETVGALPAFLSVETLSAAVGITEEKSC